MDSARTQSGKDSIFRLEVIENGLVVHKAGDNHVRAARRLLRAYRLLCPLRDERLHLRNRAIPHGQVKASFQYALGDVRAHITQANECHIHDGPPIATDHETFYCAMRGTKTQQKPRSSNRAFACGARHCSRRLSEAHYPSLHLTGSAQPGCAWPSQNAPLFSGEQRVATYLRMSGELQSERTCNGKEHNLPVVR